jgi:hypothetical protein
MGLDWWNGSVHHAFGSFIHLLCGERDKGSGRAPLVNPRGPARKSVLRTALTSRVPDCGRLDSTYSSHPWDSPLRGQRKRCSKLLPAILSLSRFASVRHPWRPDLVIHASVRRFQRGHNPIAVRPEVKALSVSLNARFCRPDKAKPPSGSGAAVIMPDGATLIRPTPFQQRYIPAIGA